MNTAIRRLLKQLEEEGKIHDARESEHSRRMLNLEPDTAALVSILAQTSRARRVLEIGTSNGYSTIWLAAAVSQAGGSVTTIERNPEKQVLARRNLEKAGLLQHVDLRLGEATEIVEKLAGPFDFVFFDADRKSAPAQLSLLLPKLARPALLLADNALSHPGEIAGYLGMIGSLSELEHSLVPVGKGLSIAFAP